MEIEHIALWARDLERLKRFYQRYFGAQASAPYQNTATGFTSYFLSFSSGARLELMHREDIPARTDDPLQQQQGLVHFAVSLGSRAKVDQLTSALKSDGYAVIDGPRVTGDGYYESVVLDPEGNRLELTV